MERKIEKVEKLARSSSLIGSTVTGMLEDGRLTYAPKQTAEEAKLLSEDSFVQVKMVGGLFDIQKSYNVLSVTDLGKGDVLINWALPLDTETPLFNIVTDPHVKYEVVTKDKLHVRVRFHDEPEIFVIKVFHP